MDTPKKVEPQPCQRCGEMMPRPISRAPKDKPPVYVCTDCYGSKKKPPSISRESGESADRQYHGGQFHNGEW